PASFGGVFGAAGEFGALAPTGVGRGDASGSSPACGFGPGGDSGQPVSDAAGSIGAGFAARASGGGCSFVFSIRATIRGRAARISTPDLTFCGAPLFISKTRYSVLLFPRRLQRSSVEVLMAVT